jgi:excinuclease ABC subunit B
LERSDILAKLRQGTYDVIVGINLLREGLDLPEVSLVAILDADKQGFLRSKVSLIQTMGRAARHISGEVILYADVMTPAMRDAIAEVERRRKIQLDYNKKNTITPTGIIKPIRSSLVEKSAEDQELPRDFLDLTDQHIEALTPFDKKKMVQSLTKAMKQASNELEFETAAKIRDTIARLTEEND